MTTETVTVTWTEQDIGLGGVSGSVRFALNGPLDATTGTTYEPLPLPFPIINGTGQSEPVLANDDPSLPAGSWYVITVDVDGLPPRVTNRYINFALGTTQALADLPVAIPVAMAPGALLLPTGTPVAGDVPAVIASGSPATAWAPQTGGGGGGFTNPMTTLGDLIIGGASGAAARLAGNATTTRKFLRQVGSGSAATAQVWDTLQAGDVPSLAGLYDALGSAATALATAESFATTAVGIETTRAEAAEALLATLASPTFTGNPAAPTKAAGNNSTSLATTGYTDAAVAVEAARAMAAEALLATRANPTFTGTATFATVSATSLSASTFVQGNRVLATGLTGATTASRYVGGTTGGAPATGTFNTGDYIVDVTGAIWVCTAAGTPGTWVQDGAALAAAAQLAAIAACLPTLTTVSVTASGTVALNKITEADSTSGSQTQTLPSPTLGALVVVEKTDATTNTVGVTGTIRGASSTITLRLPTESVMLFSTASSWYVIGDHKTLSSLDARYLLLTGGTVAGPLILNGTPTTTLPDAASTGVVGTVTPGWVLNIGGASLDPNDVFTQGARINIPADPAGFTRTNANGANGTGGGAPNTWEFRFNGGLTSYFNEFGEFRVQSAKTNTVGFKAKGISGHTVDIAQFTDSANNPLAGVDVNGGIYSVARVTAGVAALTFGSSIAVNAALACSFNLTLAASTGTLANPTNPLDGQVIRFRITSAGFTLAYGTAYDFGTAGAPTFTSGKTDIVGFEYVASLSKWCCLGAALGF